MSPALQENLLALLCFDDATAKSIRAAVGTPKLFESKIFREVAGAAIDFLDQYGVAIKEHLADELEHIIEGSDRLIARQYEKLLKQLHAEHPHINSQYVLSQLHRFVRAQTIKSALYESVMAMEEGDLDRTEILMSTALKSQSVVFEGGIDLGDINQSLDFLESNEKPFLMGVKVLDDFGVGPSRKTLFMLQAPLKRGKTWGLMHIGKMGLLQGLCVVHVTLEMSAAKSLARYYQTIFGITKNESKARVPSFSKNRDGTMSDLFYEEVETLAYSDPDIRPKLATLLKRRSKRWAPFRVKEFPSGSLTLNGLEAYLDALERLEGITPDLLILDYAELMDLGAKADDKRGATGKLFVGLRGLAQKRNMALVTASQTNRGGINKTVSDETDTAEDISKAFTCDTVITYNQTKAEYELGLARLYVAAHRDGEGRQTALISQNYASGQFCIDSVMVSNTHFEFVDRRVNRRGRNDEREEA